MSTFSFGSFSGRYDAELQAKIDAALAGKASTKDKIEDFVKEELKIDPATLPLTPKQALTNVNNIMRERGKGRVQFNGNSLGIKDVTFYDAEDGIPCPSCGSGDTNMLDAATRECECYDCYDPQGNYFHFTAPVSMEGGEVIKQRDNDKDWTELMRCYRGLITNQDGLYTVSVTHVYSGEPAPEYVTHQIEPDPKWYGTGYTLRLEKHVMGEENEYVYAKVGGLFSDKDVCRLPGMEVIEDLSMWRVVEVL